MRSHILLILFVLCGGVVFADDNLDESKAIEKIELLGGKVTRDESLAGRPVVGVSFEGSQRFNDKYIHLLRAFPKLVKLDLTGCKQITDLGLVEINQLTKLSTLLLAGTKVTDIGLEELRNHSQLAVVDLFDTDVTETGRTLILDSLPKFKEATVMKNIELLGGNVTRDETLPGHPVTRIEFQRSQRLSDGFLRLLKSFPRLTSLHLQRCKVTDMGLEEIGGLTNLTVLNLSGTKITDAGMNEICKLTNLKTLVLSQTKITDASLAKLWRMNSLEGVDLAETSITDDGLKGLTDEMRLTLLNLRGTKITDNGLQEIQKLKNLTLLNLSQTQTSNAAVEALLAALPNLAILGKRIIRRKFP